MKKIIITLAIAFSSIAVFAREANVTNSVLNSFKSDFVGAKDVKWSEANDYYKAVFVLNGQHVSAFYSYEGSLFGTSRNISSLDLPVALQNNLKNDYSDYWISDLFEVSGADGTQYYITLEKADSKLILQSVSASKWATYKKATKA